MESLEQARKYKTHPLKKHGSINTPFQLMEMFRMLWNAGLMLLIVRMMLCSVSMACSDGSNTGERERNGMKERYEKWLTRHGRSYKDREEWQLRFGIYQSNVQFIDFFNSLNYSHQLVDNKFSDMTNAEFKRIYLRYHHNEHKKTHFRYEGEKGLPTIVDWRKKGAVTPVKDQGQCGSCWAFSSVAAVEGIHKIKNGELVSLSEQELMDCDVTSDNNGCNGGYMDRAFAFIKNIGGLTTEKEYPYRGSQGTCNKSKMKSVAAKISGYERVPANEETSLQAAVSHQPVSVAIDAGGYAFQFYSRGIFTGVCGDSLNHGVAAVGYGEEGGSKYWLVKNSWGADWGESGYIRMKRGLGNSHGTCGIAMQASYPV